jgi:hypothetical protein
VLVVARTAPASQDGVQLGGVERPCVLPVRIAREPAVMSAASKNPGADGLPCALLMASAAMNGR